MDIFCVLQNTSHMATAATAESPCSDVTRARVLDPGDMLIRAVLLMPNDVKHPV